MKRIGVMSTALMFAVFGFAASIHAQDQKEAAPEKHQEEAKPEKPPKQETAKPEKSEAKPQEQRHDQDKPSKDERKQQDQQRKDQEKAAKGQQKQEQKAQQQNQKQERDQQKAAQHNQQKPDQQKDEDQRRNAQPGNDQRGNDQRGNDQRQNEQQRTEQPGRSSQPAQRANNKEQRGAFQEHRARNWQSEHRTWAQRGGYHGYRIPDDRFRASFGESHRFRLASFPVTVVEGFPRFQINGFWFALVDPWPETWSDDWYDTDDCYVTYDDDGYYLEDVRYPGVRLAINVFVG
jgi:hypothetical protein